MKKKTPKAKLDKTYETKVLSKTSQNFPILGISKRDLMILEIQGVKYEPQDNPGVGT